MKIVPLLATLCLTLLEQGPAQRVPHTDQAMAADAAKAASTSVQWSWADQKGRPLPFASERHHLEFLSTAKFVSSDRTEHGINRPLRVVIELDGTTARAVFRTVDKTWRNRRDPYGQWRRLFKDNYIYECAAYELSRGLGIHGVPPTTVRRYRGERGSLQAWVENARTVAEIQRAGERPPDVRRWVGQLRRREIFDALINNQDRNSGNTLVDARWDMWLIDHGRSFLVDPDPARVARLHQADTELVEAMRTVNREGVRQSLAPYLTPHEIRALFERWNGILEHFDELAAQ